jgi:hypothetical protein
MLLSALAATARLGEEDARTGHDGPYSSRLGAKQLRIITAFENLTSLAIRSVLQYHKQSLRSDSCLPWRFPQSRTNRFRPHLKSVTGVKGVHRPALSDALAFSMLFPAGSVVSASQCDRASPETIWNVTRAIVAPQFLLSDPFIYPLCSVFLTE